MLKNLFRSEPAVILGVLASLVQFAAEAVAGQSTWKTAVPALVGAIIRRFVTPA